MIKVIIFDGEGTLQLPNPSNEIRNLVALLPQLDITLAVASNGIRSTIENSFRSAGLPVPSIIVTPRDLGVNKYGKRITKPSPEFVYRIRDLAQVELNEIMYVGDDDRTDIFCAINAGVLPIMTLYSSAQTSKEYGLKLNTPSDLEGFIRRFARQDSPYFGWVFRDDSLGVDIRALLGDQGEVKDILRSLLKAQSDQPIGSRKISVKLLMFLYFMTQFYLSGVAGQIDIATVYPGHRAGKLNQVLSDYLSLITKMFKDSFYPDLIIRHKDAPKQQYQGDARNIFDQFRTITINEKYQQRIYGKTIVVLDDFTTAGYSLEAARHMLLQAGAQKVICLAVAKYRLTHAVAEIKKFWNPYLPCTLDDKDITVSHHSGTHNRQADEYFQRYIWSFYKK